MYSSTIRFSTCVSVLLFLFSSVYNMFCSIYVHITQSIEGTQSTSNTNEIQTGQFNCHLRGLDLENIEKGVLGLGAIDPYFELSKKYTDHDNGITRWIPVYRSEHRPNIIVSYLCHTLHVCLRSFSLLKTYKTYSIMSLEPILASISDRS